MIVRPPSPPLRPFVRHVWVFDEPAAPKAMPRERVLPTGMTHVVFRLTDHPLRVFDGVDDVAGRVVALAVVGGPRAAHYVRDVSQPTRSVGAQLQPGIASLLLGAPADELAGRHLSLDDLWGRAAGDARDRLIETGEPEARLTLFEQLLADRLPRVRGVHPAVAHALSRFTGTDDVGKVVEESGYSHRRFIALFRHAVGLGPKQYSRLLRLQRALAATRSVPDTAWVDVALAAGYSDQPHFTRDFHELTGLTPSEFRTLSPTGSLHVPIVEVKNLQDPRHGDWHDRSSKKEDPS